MYKSIIIKNRTQVEWLKNSSVNLITCYSPNGKKNVHITIKLNKIEKQTNLKMLSYTYSVPLSK